MVDKFEMWKRNVVFSNPDSRRICTDYK